VITPLNTRSWFQLHLEVFPRYYLMTGQPGLTAGTGALKMGLPEERLSPGGLPWPDPTRSPPPCIL